MLVFTVSQGVLGTRSPELTVDTTVPVVRAGDTGVLVTDQIGYDIGEDKVAQSFRNRRRYLRRGERDRFVSTGHHWGL